MAHDDNLSKGNKPKNKEIMFDKILMIILIVSIATLIIQFTLNNIKSLNDNTVICIDQISKSDQIIFNDILDTNQLELSTMVEIYDTEFNIIQQLPFDAYSATKDLIELPELQRIFGSYKEAYHRYVRDNIEETIYFKWIENDDGEIQLLVMYILEPYTDYIMTLVLYTIIFTVLILIAARSVAASQKAIDDRNKYLKYIRMR